jgi:hypothetical protein
MIAVVETPKVAAVCATLERMGERVVTLGTVTTRPAGAPGVTFTGKLDLG